MGAELQEENKIPQTKTLVSLMKNGRNPLLMTVLKSPPTHHHKPPTFFVQAH
jgi:hypothetical protein